MSPVNTPAIMLSTVMLGIALSLIILLTVGGNVLVCLAVCASRRLRCLTNCFIVSLAVTDLLLGLLVLPFSALLQFKEEWPLGPVFCNFYISMDVMLCTASILTLLAISVDRYLAVTKPLRYASLVLPWRVIVTMASVWTVSVAVSFLPIQMGWNTVNGTVQNYGPGASDRRCRFELNRPYVLTDSLLTFYLPLVIMCWTYLQILRIARAQAKRIVSARPTCITSCNCRNNPTATTTVVSSITAVALREHKATVTLAAVIGAFVVCWLPYFILFTVLGLQEHPDPSTVPEYHIVLWLGYANSAINPFLYGALNRDFRSAYAHLLRCRVPSNGVLRSRRASPTLTAGRVQVSEVTMLCSHTCVDRKAERSHQSFMLHNMNSRTAASAVQKTNGTAATEGNSSTSTSLLEEDAPRMPSNSSSADEVETTSFNQQNNQTAAGEQADKNRGRNRNPSVWKRSALQWSELKHATNPSSQSTNIKSEETASQPLGTSSTGTNSTTSIHADRLPALNK